ncbi:capsular biosynthesis protein [Bacillus sp. SA1-12]|uniref:CapA family protein n=1 Tax=Bacillus sp. SA1-12 TaxID=1455638 RepID=UPI000627175F|nr:CapA family protein [Bacillus sp. SA1-12]KKI90286.1 capsular biosynthesis protein [Bacillus sp. SA1-12]
MMMKIRLFCWILVPLLIIVSIYSFVQYKSIQEKNTDSRKKQPIEEIEQPAKLSETPIAASAATLSAIGDVLIHDRVYNPQHLGNDQYDFMPLLEPVKSSIGTSDVTVANQESMIGGAGIGLSTYPSFNSPHEVGDALKESGVDIVTMANNHTLDRGEEAIQNAINHWNKIGILYTGSFVSPKDHMTIRTIEKNGIKFSFLAYTYGTNGISIPEGKSYLVNLIDMEKIKKEIVLAKKISDVVVVSLHFGKEYERLPNDEQKQIARQTANAGADIIIGHHPHVLQPIEWITREDGKRTIVAYSLGNFLTGQTNDYKDLGGIMQIKVEKVEVNGKMSITLKDPAFLPTFVNQKYIVAPLHQVKGKTEVYEEIKKHMSQWMPELKFSLQ